MEIRYSESVRHTLAVNKLFAAVNWSLVVDPMTVALPIGITQYLQSADSELTVCPATDLVLQAMVRSFDVGEKIYQSVEISVSPIPINNQ